MEFLISLLCNIVVAVVYFFWGWEMRGQENDE